MDILLTSVLHLPCSLTYTKEGIRKGTVSRGVFQPHALRIPRIAHLLELKGTVPR
jgi:hypothetical protein